MEISTYFYPKGALGGKCFCQFCFTAARCCCLELWFGGNLRGLNPQDGAVSWTISENSSEGSSLEVRVLLILSLTRALDSKLWTADFVYRSFSSLLLLIDLGLRCSPLFAFEGSRYEGRGGMLTETAQFWCQTDLHGSTTYQLCDPWLSCPLRLCLEKWSPLNFFRVASVGKISGNYMYNKMMSHVPGTQ